MTLHKHRIGRIVISMAVGLTAPLALGVFWFNRGPAQIARADTKNEVVKAPVEAVAVSVARPRPRGCDRMTTQPATVRAFDFEELYAKVSGYLVHQKVDIGSQVKRGDMLAEIDAPELLKEEQHAAAALEQAKSQVRQMHAHVAAAKAELDAARIVVDQKQAEVKRARANLSYREKQYGRIKELADYKSVDQRLVDEQFDHFESAQAWKDSSVAGVQAAMADIESKKAKVAQAEADLDAAKANVDVAAAALQKAQVFVEFTRIRSHYNGIVTARNFHEGDFIRSADKGGALPLLVVQRRDLMRVVINVPDVDAPFCDPGDPVDFSISTLPDLKFRCKIDRISYSQDQRSRTMRVEADLRNDKGSVRDGMYGEATIHLRSGIETAVRVPSTALRRDGGKVIAFVVRDGAIEPVHVTVGTDTGSEAEVLSGLTVNDQVVLHPSAQLQSGQHVHVSQ